MPRLRTTVLSALAVSGTMLAQAPTGSGDLKTASYARLAPPSTITIEFLKEPPQLTPEQLAILERNLSNVNLSPPIGVQSGAVAGPTGPETTPTQVEIGGAIPSAGIGPPAEPAGSPNLKVGTAESRGYVFYVANGFAARRAADSPDAWTYINPLTTMPDFCCDQEIIVDRARDMLLWYREGSYQADTGQGRFTLSVSNDGGASFCSYSVSPNALSSSLTNRSWKSSNLSLTKDYLYVSADVHQASGAYDRKLVLRWPLDLLKSCSGVDVLHLTAPNRALLVNQFIR